MFKRVFDILVALLLLLGLFPVMILVALLIRWAMGGRVLFRQQRPGLHGKPFTMVKFRTMREAVDSHGKPLSDEVRLTRLGCFLRQSSLDELPALLNVLKGEMSMVGPRPLLIEYLPLYSKEQMRRHDVMPGITGWAQVNGRNDISWDEKFCLDTWYVDNRTFLLDIRILLMTIWKVLKWEGISQKGHITVEKFTGNKNK